MPHQKPHCPLLTPRLTWQLCITSQDRLSKLYWRHGAQSIFLALQGKVDYKERAWVCVVGVHSGQWSKRMVAFCHARAHLLDAPCANLLWQETVQTTNCTPKLFPFFCNLKKGNKANHQTCRPITRPLFSSIAIDWCNENHGFRRLAYITGTFIIISCPLSKAQSLSHKSWPKICVFIG